MADADVNFYSEYFTALLDMMQRVGIHVGPRKAYSGQFQKIYSWSGQKLHAWLAARLVAFRLAFGPRIEAWQL